MIDFMGFLGSLNKYDIRVKKVGLACMILLFCFPLFCVPLKSLF